MVKTPERTVDHMVKVNLEMMSLDEFKALHKDVESAITNYEKRQRNEVLAAIDAAAKEHGFKLAELMSGGKSAKVPAAPKYRHPENSSLN